MKVILRSVCFILWFCYRIASTENTQETNIISTTEAANIFTETIVFNVTDTPIDNGMVIRDIGDPADFHYPYSENKKEFTVEPSSTPVIFPKNHKNISTSLYYDGEIPPRLNLVNKYQEQYENYYDQKNLYNAKPLKFEENTFKNYFLPYPYYGNGDFNLEQSEYVMKPFPYAFESHKAHGYWFTNPGKDQFEEFLGSDDVSLDDNKSPKYYFHKNPEEHKIEFENHNHNSNNDVSKEKKYKTSWNKIAQLVTALVPLGLLLATLTPTVFTVDSNAPVNFKTSRERTSKSNTYNFTEDDVNQLMKRYGVNSMSMVQCEDRIICELAKNGNKSTANLIEKGFWYLANKTPKNLSKETGMNELFEAIKTGNCESFTCKTKGENEKRKRIKKRISKRRKNI